jgi:hypothetical protein
MGADPIVYCLQQLTDYDQFERLCNDLMSAEGYKNIEPIGGRGDKGRDAICESCSSNEETTIFAYSVRGDWFQKLKSDASRIKEVGHKCDNLVFCCTAYYSPTDRDNSIKFIRDNYGWNLELYGIERIRTLLASVHEGLLTKHPHIFTPPFFPMAGGQPLSLLLDLVVIDYTDQDEAIALWLARKLKLIGYSVWCRSIDPIGGESINETTEALLEQRAMFYITVLSDAALLDNDYFYRRSIGIRIMKKRSTPFLIPIVSRPIFDEALDSNIRKLEKIDFVDSWQEGLNKVAAILETSNCPKAEGGKHFVLDSFFPNDVILDQEETIISNMYQVKKIPKVIQCFESSISVSSTQWGRMSSMWAFRAVNRKTYLSFQSPPDELITELKLKKIGETVWRDASDINGIDTINLVVELIKKALNVVCQKKGLKYCPLLKLTYFPSGLIKRDRFYFKYLDGTKTNMSVFGERKYFKPKSSEYYRYYLSPSFHVSERRDGSFTIVTHLHIRLTDKRNRNLEGKSVLSRRKRLCKDWFNDEWAKRIFGVMQFISDNGEISIGKLEEEMLIIDSYPCMWKVPLSINEEALSLKAIDNDEVIIRHNNNGEDIINAEENR